MQGQASRQVHAPLSPASVLKQRSGRTKGRLPKGFHKVRYYGLWRPSRHAAAAQARLMLALGQPIAVRNAPTAIPRGTRLITWPQQPSRGFAPLAETGISFTPAVSIPKGCAGHHQVFLSPELSLAHAIGHATDRHYPPLSSASRYTTTTLRRPLFTAPRRRCTRRSRAPQLLTAGNSGHTPHSPQLKNP